MKGFFFNSPSPRKPGGVKGSRTPREPKAPRTFGAAQVPALPVCSSCRLFEGCTSPKIPVTGGGARKILFVAEAPGETEDADGLHLVGRSGQVLEERLKGLGIDLDRDCWTIASVNCRPPGGRTPTMKEVDWCRPSVVNAIKAYRPKVVIPLGKIALESLLAHRWPKGLGGIAPWRGFTIPDREYKAWVVPTYTPTQVLWGDSGDALDLQFCGDLERAMGVVDTPLPFFREEVSCVRLLQTPEEACDYLDKLIFDAPELCAFDYETTGLKPYHPNHRVVCASLAPSDGEAVAFIFPKDTPNKDKSPLNNLWRRFLAERTIGKIASNLKFEHVWSLAKFGVEPENWQWDTMIAAHVIDNRPGITSVKFQAYVLTGLIGYDEDVAPYLKSSDKDEKEFGGNAFNQIDKAPVDKLLTYCAIDSLAEYRVAAQQMDVM